MRQAVVVSGAVAAVALVGGLALGARDSSGRDEGPVITDVESWFAASGLEARDGGDFGRQNLSIVDDGEQGRVLRVRYPRGSASPTAARSERRPVGGAQRYLALPDGRGTEQLRLTFSVRFEDGFDFVRGGKLPGLYGGEVTGGRRRPDGTDGFSTRFMWRDGGRGEVYAYLPTSRGEGTSLGRGLWRFEPGRWHEVDQEVRLNEPGAFDGLVRVWLDGEQVLDEDGLLYRTVDDLRIEGVLFSTFFGGSDGSWATPRDTTVDFARLRVNSS